VSRAVKKEHSDTVANHERVPKGCSAGRERLLLLCSDVDVGASFGRRAQLACDKQFGDKIGGMSRED
jgi:hypothetical protein